MKKKDSTSGFLIFEVPHAFEDRFVVMVSAWVNPWLVNRDPTGNGMIARKDFTCASSIIGRPGHLAIETPWKDDQDTH